MNTAHVDAIANAVLYEGYMLYPYRPSSVKNRQRFNFGVLYPRPYCEAQSGSDAWSLHTECLIEATDPLLDVKLRFLKLMDRSLLRVNDSGEHFPETLTTAHPVSTIGVEGKGYVPWQEATECEVNLPSCEIAKLVATPLEWKFAFPAKEETENLCNASGMPRGLLVRRQEPVEGVVEVGALAVSEGVFKVQVSVKNLACGTEDATATRDQALARSLLSAHVLLGVKNGRFVSLLEPSEGLREVATACQNVGVWPVLVGAEGTRDTMLASPIILYDYPQVAAESPGDLFDGTEIDEILALRILTMTDAEKDEMRQADERARKMLERTEALPMEHLMKLHGTLRELRPSGEEMP
jgi:hypothetical protein